MEQEITYPHWRHDPRAELAQDWVIPEEHSLPTPDTHTPSSGYALVFFLVAVIVFQQYKRWWQGEKE